MTGNRRIHQMPHEQQFTYWNRIAERNGLFRTLDESQMTGNHVNIVQYPSVAPNFLGVRRRMARELSRADAGFLRLLGRFIGGGSLTAQMTDAQFLRLLEVLYALH